MAAAWWLCWHCMAVPGDLSSVWVSVQLVGGWVWLHLGVGVAGGLGLLSCPGWETGTSAATPVPCAAPHPALVLRACGGGCHLLISCEWQPERGQVASLSLWHPPGAGFVSKEAGHEPERGHGDSGAWERRGQRLPPGAWVLPIPGLQRSGGAGLGRTGRMGSAGCLLRPVQHRHLPSALPGHAACSCRLLLPAPAACSCLLLPPAPAAPVISHLHPCADRRRQVLPLPTGPRARSSRAGVGSAPHAGAAAPAGM